MLVLLTQGVFKEYLNQKGILDAINSLPDVHFLSLDGDSVSLSGFDPSRPLVIRYFHADCDHCRQEALELSARAELFNDIQVVMITPDDSVDRILSYAEEYHLFQIDNLIILMDTHQQFKKRFGNAMIPSTYIYDQNQNLLHRFMGETHPEAILNLLTPH